MLTSGVAAVNNTQLYYEEIGNGFPVVLVHGGAVGCGVWDACFTAFGDRYRTVRYDCRGYARSARIEEPFSPEEDLRALLDFLKIESAAIVGSSTGGTVALDLAIARPDRVAALVLVAPYLTGYPYSAAFQKRSSSLFQAYRNSGAAGLVTAAIADPHFPPAQPPAREKLRSLLESNTCVFEQDWRLQRRPGTPAIERLEAVLVPTLVLAGDRDDADSRAAASLLEQQIGLAKKVTVANAGHLIHLERPGVFELLVSEFLAQCVPEDGDAP